MGAVCGGRVSPKRETVARAKAPTGAAETVPRCWILGGKEALLFYRK